MSQITSAFIPDISIYDVREMWGLVHTDLADVEHFSASLLPPGFLTKRYYHEPKQRNH